MRIGGNLLPELSFGPLWVTILSLVPFFINLGILLFVAVKGARTKLNFSFVLFLLVLAAWQLTESFGRTSLTAEGASLFVRISLYPMLFIPIFGTLFILRLTGQTRMINSPLFFIVYFVFPILTGFILITESYSYQLIPSDIFNWTSTPESNPPTLIFFGYILITCGGMISFVWRGYFRSDLQHYYSNQINILAWGFTIPVILGVVSEILLPVLTDSQAFPMTNVSVLSFSFASIYALYKSRIFLTVPKHEWRYILDHMDDGIIVVNNNMQIRYANKKALQILECRKNKLPEFDIKSSIAHSGIDLVRMATEKQSIVVSEFNLKTSTERSRRVKATFRVFQNRETNNEETLIILSDIHNLRKAEEESVLKSKQLSSFLYRTSHDLKNPVVCIEGLLTLYREGSVEEKEKCIDLIEVSNNRIKNILQSMAAVTQFNQHQTKLGDVKVSSIVEQLELKLKERKSPVQIISNITNDTIIRSDQVLLTFIFTELMINADRFRRPLIQNPVLELRYSYNNGNQYFSFADNGIGIPEKVTGELFGIFFRGHEHSGAGMGLYSVKWICDKLGYQISYKRNSKGYTEFILTIPKEVTTDDALSSEDNPEYYDEQLISA
jgi:signal transduction histidine kinase